MHSFSCGVIIKSDSDKFSKNKHPCKIKKEGYDVMKKKATIFAACLALVAIISTALVIIYTSSTRQLSDDGLFLYDSSRHIIHGAFGPSPFIGNPFRSFEEFHSVVRESPYSAIIIGEVAGPSINRIITPANHLKNFFIPGADNHVITPILVHYTILMGEDAGT